MAKSVTTKEMILPNYVAGRGGDHEFINLKNPNDTDDSKGFVPNEHYLKLEVVRWYINTNSNIFRKKMAGGTVEIKIGLNNVFKIALGQFNLRRGAKSSTARDDLLIPNKIYMGGDLEVRVYLQGIARRYSFVQYSKGYGVGKFRGGKGHD